MVRFALAYRRGVRELLVVIDGELGSGKTTLARALAPRLGAALLSKDLLKEAMHEPLALDTNDASRAASVAAIRIMYAIRCIVTAQCRQSGSTSSPRSNAARSGHSL